ncbi:MAG: hypothetical protein FJY67_03825 [Calditrichaeota bacterium]|nr:hypothetical protein [Calditrichota bacterium]
MSAFHYIPVTLIALVIVSAGCEGPTGPAGRNARGVDLQPPTIELTRPWPLETAWDSVAIAAAAVDNVAISRVVFTVDGMSRVGGEPLVAATTPYQVKVAASSLGRGWHMVAARAYDTAGNVSDAPPRSIYVGFKADLNDTTLVLARHSGMLETVWRLPDTIRTDGYWVRFEAAKLCSVGAVTIQAGGAFSDTARVQVGLWSGSVLPVRAEATSSLFGTDVRGSIREHRFAFSGRGSRMSGTFFIVIGFASRSQSDTLQIGSDGGEPHWGVGGSHDDSGWHGLRERFGRRNNLLVTAELYYPPADTGR